MQFLNTDYEDYLINKKGFKRIVGIDEVGRGCWAGPVAIGAYIYKGNNNFTEGVKDSKKLTLKKRIELHKVLSLNEYLVTYGDVELIDKYGIGKAIEKLMLRVVNQYSDGKTFFLIDGTFRQNFGENSKKFIRGDNQFFSIGAASILAKVERDRLMDEYAIQYGNYGFEKHKGYGTKFHRESLLKFGVSPIHRKSYKPIKELL